MFFKPNNQKHLAEQISETPQKANPTVTFTEEKGRDKCLVHNLPKQSVTLALHQLLEFSSCLRESTKLFWNQYKPQHSNHEQRTTYGFLCYFQNVQLSKWCHTLWMSPYRLGHYYTLLWHQCLLFSIKKADTVSTFSMEMLQ